MQEFNEYGRFIIVRITFQKELKKIVIINLKHYRNSSGKGCEEFLEKFRSFRAPEDYRIIFALNPIDLRLAEKFPTLSIYSQHVDSIDHGAFTGRFSMDSLMELGVTGSILNHSERRLDFQTIEDTVKKSNSMNFPVIVCCESPTEAEKIAEIHPAAIAYEPPELIGGKVSVTTAKPEIITETVGICRKRNVPLLVGAGVKNAKDLSGSLKLGSAGVLLASGIVLSEDPVSSLNSLIVNK